MTPVHQEDGMTLRVEYQFGPPGTGFLSVLRPAKRSYDGEIQKQACDGRRLVRILAPPIGGYGSAKYSELVIERPLSQRRQHL